MRWHLIEIMRVENLTKNNVFNDISFNIRKGEILGIETLSTEDICVL